MDFSRFIDIRSGQMSLDERHDELDTLAKERLAEEVQSRLRGQVDPGVSFPRAKRAQAVKVRSADGRLIIQAEDQAAVLRDVAQPAAQPPQPAGIDQLFELGSGVPNIEYDAAGNPRPVFRSMPAEDLFQEQRQELQDKFVSETVGHVIQGDLVDVYDEAARELARRYPETK